MLNRERSLFIVTLQIVTKDLTMRLRRKFTGSVGTDHLLIAFRVVSLLMVSRPWAYNTLLSLDIMVAEACKRL